MLLLYNGKISTLDPNNSEFSAIGIENGRILFLGSDEEGLKKNCSNKIDLQGKRVLPGFIDSHMHLIHYAFFSTNLVLFGQNSIKDIQEMVQKKIQEKKSYILGMGWNQAYLEEKRMITKDDLDAVSTEIPICLLRSCGHIASMNTKALEMVKTKGYHPGYEPLIDWDKGILREEANKLYMSILPDFTTEDIEELIRYSVSHLHKAGITSIHSDDFQTLPCDFEEIIKAYRSLEEKDELNIRVHEQCLFLYDKEFKRFIDAGYSTDKDGDSLFRLGPRKLLQDGSLGARTAAMREPYSDKDTLGDITFDQKTLDHYVQEAADNNMSVAIHGIGDKAIEMGIDAIEKTLVDDPKNTIRNSIVHSQITPADLIKRMADSNILALIQPNFIEDDMNVVYERLGKERAESSYCWKSMLEASVPLSGGSDSPVTDFNIMKNIYAAVTRKNLAGTKEYLPEEGLDIDTAIRLFTQMGAYPSFDENKKGTLETGKFADLVVLEEDLYTVEKEHLKDIEIAMTICNGKIVYENKEESYG